MNFLQIKTNQFQKEIKEHGNYYFPFLISYEKLSRYESGSFLWHWHPEIELTFVTKGKMMYKVNHISFLLNEGQALFLQRRHSYDDRRKPHSSVDADRRDAARPFR